MTSFLIYTFCLQTQSSTVSPVKQASQLPQQNSPIVNQQQNQQNLHAVTPMYNNSSQQQQPMSQIPTNNAPLNSSNQPVHYNPEYLQYQQQQQQQLMMQHMAAQQQMAAYPPHNVAGLVPPQQNNQRPHRGGGQMVLDPLTGQMVPAHGMGHY